ncbi:MAG: 50S ribosomal protein L25/general stress protein Ctc [Rhodospirillaceae bacterium TMED8]|nr:50S ribosomal protein L25/general stress protein Ctc [Magnetovibrio sp.]OUT47714.1 MAG: 50S ribosomal protein L25/general stress protein Ctc [Rhodospirillaceae bacterium TMED8]|tara:strand:+ start:131 stop:811 length:681 start_codon:yes stop_codon:yes gene_type:complete
MVNPMHVSAEGRDRAGKGAARATRRGGRVPGVIYGNKQDAVLISMDPVDLQKQVSMPGFFGRVFDIEVNGTNHRVLPRELQVDPVTDRPIHVDFMRFSASTRVAVEVTVNFLNEEGCPGLKLGGVLNVVRFAVELLCAPDNIPETLEADLSGLEIGDSIHISAISLPEGVEPTVTDRDFTIATIAPPTVAMATEEEDEDSTGAQRVDGVSGGEKSVDVEGDGKEKT